MSKGKSKEPLISSPCKDCGKDTTPCDRRGKPIFKQFDFYIVRDEIWAEAGMIGWESGHLCTPCLERRLGRKLVEADYLSRPTGATKKGLTMEVDSDYFQSRAWLKGGGRDE